MQRRLEITPEEVSGIRAQMLMFVGDNTPHENEAVNVLKQLKPNQAEWLRVNNAGFLITEDKPQACVEPLKLFLNGRGYF